MELDNSNNLRKACEQKACPIAISGKCLEGLDIDDCPHFYWEDTIENNAEIEDNFQITPEFITLISGEDLSIAETTLITYKFKAAVIVIIGEYDSGKTTLASTIHELFQLGPFNNLWFAGSVTPLAFEKRCHYSRLASGSKKSKTEKTKAGDFKFLHIALKQEDDLTGAAHNLLISDISGEIYKLARNSSDYMRSLTLLKTVNRILITLDGEKLASKKLRNVELTNAKTFIRKAIEEGIFNSHTYLDIVITKWDILGQVTDFSVENMQKILSEILLHKVAELNFIYIAARPNSLTEGINLGYGINNLLDKWISSKENRIFQISSTLNPPTNSTRQFYTVLNLEI
ncbi:hypothetical protein GCM10028805_45990 [Spirosoma harenae]